MLKLLSTKKELKLGLKLNTKKLLLKDWLFFDNIDNLSFLRIL